MLSPRAHLGERGSGTAIGVAVMFPMLMLVIVAVSMLSDSARTEQALQAAADRAAHTASLCCFHTGGPMGAEAVAKASLEAAHEEHARSRISCSNDFLGDSTVRFVDVGDNRVDVDPASAVPPGGTVYVHLRCDIPPQALGGFGWPGLNVRRTALGVASVDPYRFRPGA